MPAIIPLGNIRGESFFVATLRMKVVTESLKTLDPNLQTEILCHMLLTHFYLQYFLSCTLGYLSMKITNINNEFCMIIKT